MKEVVFGEELKKLMVDAINLLCDAVGSTLGPSGNNVLINNDETSPFITNDGVTIANAISSNDKKINTILEIIKEASLKTNEVVGDGTTTTLVLLKSIFNNGLKEIENGKKAIELKRELNITLNKIIDELNKLSRIPNEVDLNAISTISTEDRELGLFLSELFKIMKSKYAIKLSEGNIENTYYEIKKGYNLEIDNIPNIYFQNSKEIVLHDVYVLLLRGYLDNLEVIADIINEGLNRNKNILILAEDYSDMILEQVILYYLQMNKNIYLFKLPDYASRKEAIIKDIVSLTNSSIKNIGYDNIYFDNLGYINEFIISKDEITIVNDIDINDRLNEIKDEFNNSYDDYEKEFLANRISKLENGMATIYVGGKTKTEIKEKLMRLEDGLCALEVAKDGVLVGEGISLLKVSKSLKNETIGDKIMIESLKVPFNKIMENAIGNYDNISKEIEKANYEKIYNFDSNELEDINNTSIIDPTKVTIETLKNAVSIASMLLTTNYLVISENINVDKNIL